MAMSAVLLPLLAVASGVVAAAAAASGSPMTARDIDPSASCPASNLVCDGGRCVDYTYQCDGDLDCVDGADERGCPGELSAPLLTRAEHHALDDVGRDRAAWSRQPGHPAYRLSVLIALRVAVGSAVPSSERCPHGHFRCDRTRCIQEAFRCDGDVDCTDGADERGCSACNDGGFHCDGSRCIDSDRLCDGRGDCEDGADERNCSECPEDRHQCDGARCLSAEERCDGVPQCRDATDEVNCTECSDTARMCGPGRCVPTSVSCEAKPDCEKDADHPACSVSPPAEPWPYRLRRQPQAAEAEPQAMRGAGGAGRQARSFRHRLYRSPRPP
ncbi:Low-density lipoprotein receptor-related protein 2 [Frankliniella fusca]|uniref:Low-density lipoprotein receptor-related protein 2 n=1 Tax=Frankliniella fusca TaxID=407009 RepID=A0AAE1LQK9_9NEOP|nr:Low-density lipoprotein receptor-related protein 2 [Frankliniella fusca]